MQPKIKQFFMFLAIGAFIGLSMYLFVVPFAYLVKFKSELPPLSIYSFVDQNVTDKEEWQDKLHMTQVLETPDKQDVKLFWEIEYDGEISAVTIKIIFTENQWREKLKILVLNAPLLDSALTRIKEIYKEMKEDMESFGWTIPKNDQLNGSDCLCVDLESTFREKPRLMNEHVDRLAYYAQNVANRSPRLYIRSINFLDQFFAYSFCFPVDHRVHQKEIPDGYFYKKQPNIGTNSIDFYGNFAATQRFWANLYDSLKLNQKEIKYPVVEEFLDSPFSGKDDKEWHSKLYF